MTESSFFLLDTNVFIEAKNRYYAFAICPGFWSSIVGHFESGDLCSIDDVKQEILRGKDDLVEWVEAELPDEFFKASHEDTVIENYKQIILWVNNNTQFYESAKADFLAGADGWVLAYAQAKNLIVVTQEQFRKSVRNKVPMPNVCEQFGIQYRDTFFMLKTLNVQLEWTA